MGEQSGRRRRVGAAAADTTVAGSPPAATYTVGQVAAMAGVSVRTLHHYDETGVLVPSSRRRSGYREYDTQHRVSSGETRDIRAFLHRHMYGTFMDDPRSTDDHVVVF